MEKARSRILRLHGEWNASEPGKGHDTKLAEWKARLGAVPAEAPEPGPHGGR